MSKLLLKHLKYILTAVTVLVVFLSLVVLHIARMEKIRLPGLSEKIFGDINLSLNPVIESAKKVAEDPFLLKWMEEGENRMALDIYLKDKAFVIGCTAIDLASDKTKITYQSAGTQVTMNRGNDRDSWFYSLAESENNSSIEMYYDTLSGTLYLYYNLKIFNRQNEFSGVLGLLIQYDKLADYLKKYETDNRKIYCLNKSGEIIIHSDQTKIGTVPIYDAYGFLQSPLKTESDTGIFTGNNSDHWFFRKGPVFRDIRHLPDLDVYLVIEHKLTLADLF